MRAGRRGQPGRGHDQVGGGAAVGGGRGHRVDARRELVEGGAGLALLGLDQQAGALGEGGEGVRLVAAAPADHGRRQQPPGQFAFPVGQCGAGRLRGARVHAEGGQGAGDAAAEAVTVRSGEGRKEGATPCRPASRARSSPGVRSSTAS